ncbi:MAG: hypothetical protein EP343_15400 [Deltaproteobacteria bacterium]|nr:MAG: hypothetical protein EP343_15400 [Deltaproteobacteria bacterium]
MSDSRPPAIPESMRPSSRKSRLRLLWIALIVLGGVPAIALGVGKKWSKEAYTLLQKKEKKGLEKAKQARSVFQVLRYVPFWSHWIPAEQSLLLYHVGHGIKVYSVETPPPPGFKKQVIQFLVEMLPLSRKAEHRKAAESYLYESGYHTELLRALKKAKWPEDREYMFRAALFRGNFKLALNLLESSPDDEGWRIRDYHWLTPYRLQCVLGKFGPGMTALQKTIANPMMEFRRGGESISTPNRVEVLLVQIECAMRGGAYAVVKKAIPMLSSYGSNGKVMAAYFQARLHARTRSWKKVDKALPPVLLRTNSGYPLTALAAELKLQALAELKQWDTILQTKVHWGHWYWKIRKYDVLTLKTLFERHWATSPERWLRIAELLRKGAKGHEQENALLTIADDAQTVAAMAHSLRRDPLGVILLSGIKNRQHKQRIFDLFAKLWGAQTFTPKEFDQLAGINKIQHTLQDSVRIWSHRPNKGVKGWHKLLQSKPKPTKEMLEQLLQTLPSTRSISPGLLLYNVTMRLKYGSSLRLSRIGEWRGILSRWQALIRSQPNMVLLLGAKL